VLARGTETPFRSKATVTKADIVHAVYTRLGGFSKKESADLVDLNPQTGEPITITQRRVLNFKASQLLKQALNGSEESTGAVALDAPKDG